MLCYCDTKLLEHVQVSRVAANEGTGASANGGADVLANEANSEKNWREDRGDRVRTEEREKAGAAEA